MKAGPRLAWLLAYLTLGLLLFGAVPQALAYTNLTQAYAAAGFDPNFPSNATVVVFSDPHLHLDPSDGYVDATNFNTWFVDAVNGMNPPPARMIVSGDLTSTYAPSPGWPPSGAGLYYGTNEMNWWYSAISALTNVPASNIRWVPGNHDQVESETNADLFCGLLQRPPHEVMTLAGVTFFMMNGGNCGMPPAAEQQWVREQARLVDTNTTLAVVVHQPPFSTVTVDRGIGPLLREVFADRFSRWWAFCGHGHRQSSAVFSVGQSRVFMNATGTVNTNVSAGLTHGAGFYILCLSNGIAGTIYYHWDNSDFQVLNAPDWAHPVPYAAAFENVPGLLWRRLKIPTPAPEVIVSRSAGSLYWYAYTSELQWSLPLGRHANKATHFQLLSTSITGTVSFSSNRTDWVTVPLARQANQVWTYPIPPAFASLSNLYARLLCTNGDAFVGGWGISTTNPPPWVIFPQLEAIPNQSTIPGRPVALSVGVIDPYVPPDTLIYSLVSAPPGATLDPMGNFYWLPGTNDVATINTVTIKVRDVGTPEMSATASFQIQVGISSSPVLSVSQLPGQGIELRASCVPGTIYDLLTSTNLVTWTLVSSTNATSTEIRFLQPLDQSPARFYRLQVADP